MRGYNSGGEREGEREGREEERKREQRLKETREILDRVRVRMRGTGMGRERKRKRGKGNEFVCLSVCEQAGGRLLNSPPFQSSLLTPLPTLGPRCRWAQGRERVC